MAYEDLRQKLPYIHGNWSPWDGEKQSVNGSHEYFLQVLVNLISAIRNSTGEFFLDESIVYRLAHNRRVSDGAYFTLIVVYSIVILAGASGNILVIWAVVRQPAMRTLRNAFIVNLAVSDLLLCILTSPLTLIQLLTYYWPFGYSDLTCKLAGGLEAVSVFVSTMSITAIAIDRYQLIVYPTQEWLQKFGTAITLFVIWVLGFSMAAPLFAFRMIEHHPLWGTPGLLTDTLDFCLETWPISHGRTVYSAASLVIQYALPIITVSAAHARISRKLRYRLTSMMSMSRDTTKQAQEQRRLRRTNTLLVAIACIFAICWMPLNIFNLIVDLYYPFDTEQSQEMLITYAVCHLVGMSSACANPLLYGWLNENFRKEFRDIGVGLIVCLRESAINQNQPQDAQDPIDVIESRRPSNNINDPQQIALYSTCTLRCEITQSSMAPSPTYLQRNSML